MPPDTAVYNLVIVSYSPQTRAAALLMLGVGGTTRKTSYLSNIRSTRGFWGRLKLSIRKVDFYLLT
jgi:hypothetical protein